MKAKIFSLSLLSMVAVPNGGAMETVEQAVGQALVSFYEVVKKPDIFNTLTEEKEEAQVQAAIAGSLVPDLMRQKADAEIQLAVATQAEAKKEFSILEKKLATDTVQTIDLTTLTLQALPASVISSQSASVFFDYLDSLKNGQNASIIEGAKNTYNEEGRPRVFKLLAAISYLKIAQITTNQVTERLTKEHHAQMEANRIAMEKKLAEVAKEQEGTKNSLTQTLQEQVSTSNDVTALPGIGEELLANLAHLTLESLPQDALSSKANLFKYLDSLKNGMNDSLIERSKEAYIKETRNAHAAKLQAALSYLKIAYSATGALQDQLAKTKEQLRDHRDAEEEIRQKLTIAESRVMSLTSQLEEAQSTTIVEGVEESKIMLGAGEGKEIDFSQTTLLTYAKESQIYLFDYLDSIKNGKNDLIIQRAKDAYTKDTRAHVYKLGRAIDYLMAAQEVAGILQAQMAASQKK